jgi:anthranilate synthase component I
VVTSILTNEKILLSAEPMPVVRELPADLETPISVYLKLRDAGPSFLLESVTGGEQVARYSFIGVQPRQVYVVRADEVEIHDLYGEHVDHVTLNPYQDPMDLLKTSLKCFNYHHNPNLPRLVGGLVGYMSYELMRYFEPSVQLRSHDDLPEAIFLKAETLIVFDHAFQKLLLVSIPHPDDPKYTSFDVEFQFDAIEKRLRADLPVMKSPTSRTARHELKSNLSQEQFTQAVLAAKERIAAGDIFQLVLSQRLNLETEAEPFEIYRALRRLNPSPYMFFFDFGELVDRKPYYLIGASPEMHARLEGDLASLRPIAGTRRRGKTPSEDLQLEQELLADTKELAEHVMLVDLGRNDLGRICQFGTVDVTERMVVERYSHVMHIVSHIQGRLRPEYDAFDLLRATFPAGTVTGAPKIRAMQILNELEQDPRGPYAGAVGYFSFDGGMDTCIAIRTMVMRGKQVEIQAGAGIVADSIPENEYFETLNKARALAAAIELAEMAV